MTSEATGVCFACRNGHPSQCPRGRGGVAPAEQLRYGAPYISPGEDWRSRSLAAWWNLARGEECLIVEHTDDGPAGDPATWCGNVRIGDRLYGIHRGDVGGRTIRTCWEAVDGAYVATGLRERAIAGPSVWAAVVGGGRG